MILVSDDDRRILRMVSIDKKYNFIGRHNDFLCKTWFDFAKEFNYGIALVGFKENNFDYLGYQAKFKAIQDKGTDSLFNNEMPIGFYRSPFSRPDEYKYNFIDTKGEYLSKEWFDEITFLNSSKDYAYVQKDDENNIVNGFGLMILDYNPDNIVPVLYNRFFKITKNNKSNYLYGNSDRLISDEWFDDISHESENGNVLYAKRGDAFYRIFLDGKIELIDRSHK